MRAANRVFINTGIQYFRAILTFGIALYSTRLILDALGVIDYGLYNLLAGIVAMLAFINSSMTITTQRYLSYGIGKDDINYRKQVFINSFWLHIVIAIVVFVIIEVIGLFLFDGFLNIPLERLKAAKFVYHAMAFNIFISICTVPFTAVLISHENFLYQAVRDIVYSLLKLGVAFLLFIIHSDKLIIYSLLIVGIALLNLIQYSIFCLKKYDECVLVSFKKANAGIKELGGFAGWNLFSTFSGIGVRQGLAIMLNVFFGAAINAAYGIAHQVSSQLQFFCHSLLYALRPQVIQSEGKGDRQRMLRLAMIESKFGFFLIAIVAIPVLFEMDAILSLWLKNVPNYTITFCQFIVIAAMLNQITEGLQTANQATGKIKNFVLTVSILRLLALPAAFLLMKLGYSAPIAISMYALFDGIQAFARLFVLKRNAGLSISLFFKRVIFQILLPVLASSFACYFIVSNFAHPYRFLYTITFSVIIFVIFIYLSGLQKDEKEEIRKIILMVKKKLGFNN